LDDVIDLFDQMATHQALAHFTVKP
jgi:hypothetical protein